MCQHRAHYYYEILFHNSHLVLHIKNLWLYFQIISMYIDILQSRSSLFNDQTNGLTTVWKNPLGSISSKEYEKEFDIWINNYISYCLDRRLKPETDKLTRSNERVMFELPKRNIIVNVNNLNRWCIFNVNFDQSTHTKMGDKNVQVWFKQAY